MRAVITINNATNCDWEDISVGIGPGGLWYIYVGDIGGNAGKKIILQVHKVEIRGTPGFINFLFALNPYNTLIYPQVLGVIQFTR